MILIALAIIKDSKGNTVGAKFRKPDGSDIEYNTKFIASNKDSIHIKNAVITDKGFIRSKKGNLPVLILDTSIDAIKNRDRASSDKIVKSKAYTLYHGNKDKHMIPKFGAGKPENDYGIGFYTTPDPELGKEWAYIAYSKGDCGYLHEFKDIDLSGLSVLNFTKLDSIHWIAELAYHREITSENDDLDTIILDRIERLKKYCKLDTSKYDIIIGYRADDSYFSYAKMYLGGRMYKETLERAFRLGDLGLQVFFKSKKAFDRLLKSEHNIYDVDPIYRVKANKRDSKARNELHRVVKENRSIKIKETIDTDLNKFGG